MGDATSDPTPPSGRLAAAATLALLFVPVTALRAGAGDYTLLMPWGFLNTAPLAPDRSIHVYTVASYFLDGPPVAALPRSITVWPVALACHLLAAGSAVAGALFGREDRRVTGGLLVLAAVGSAWVAVGVGARGGSPLAAPPLGAAVTLGVAAAFYGPALRRAVAR
ncbi:hypothetical protein GCM10027435_00770 [Haloparvum alkalitolerans]|uniref:TIGR04206 family protein n=1 Tax=Haloparvum alkalitolerans TaxID=1042953 RepID=UPI003CEBC454